MAQRYLRRFWLVNLVVGACASGACSLLAPSDESLLGGPWPGAEAGAAGAEGGGAAGGGESAGGAAAGGAAAGSSAGAPDPAGGDAGAGGREHCSSSEDCGAGQFCGALGSCTSCQDLTSVGDPLSIAFGDVEELDKLNDAADLENLRFPRELHGGAKLTYVRDFFGGQIWLTGDFTASVGAPLDSPIDAAMLFESGDLWFGEKLPNELGRYNFFFQRTAEQDSNRQALFGAVIDAAGNATEVAALPQPFNAAAPTLRSSYGLALSRDRAVWTVNADGNLDVRLYTVALDGDPTPSTIPLTLEGGCSTGEFEYTPFLTPDGRLLFFSAKERTADCQPLPENPSDIFVVELDEAGQPRSPAVALAGVNQAASSDMDPALSADRCWLYFASARHESGRLRLYRARRTR